MTITWILNKNVILWYLKRQSSAIHLSIQQIFEHPLYIKGQRYSAQETVHVLMELYGGGKTDKQTIKRLRQGACTQRAYKLGNITMQSKITIALWTRCYGNISGKVSYSCKKLSLKPCRKRHLPNINFKQGILNKKYWPYTIKRIPPIY